MGLKMILYNIKKNINLNFLFMMIVTLTFVIVSFFTQSTPQSVMGYSYFEFLLKGYVFMFIFLSYELSKELLQAEKMSRRLEWYLANNINLSTIIFSYSLNSYILTNLMVFPILIITIYFTKSFIIKAFLNYLITTFIYSIILNVSIINTKNMNKIKHISIKITSLHFLMLLLEYVWMMYNINISFLVIQYVILVIVTIFYISRTTKENIVTAYY